MNICLDGFTNIEFNIVSGLINSNKKRLARKADSLSQKVQEHGE